MKIEYHKSYAINNTSRDIWIVTLSNGLTIPVEEIQYVDDTIMWIIKEWYFYTTKVFSLEEIITSFEKRHDAFTEITWQHD